MTPKERIAELERQIEELRRQADLRARETSTLREQVETLRKQKSKLRIRLDAWKRPGNGGAQRGLRIRLGQLANSPAYEAFPDILRLQKRMRVHKVGITRFLGDAAIPWHNNHSEGDIRDIARYRAVSGGTRSDEGSKNLGHWMSITQTRRKNGLPLGPFVVAVYNAHLHGTARPSVFA